MLKNRRHPPFFADGGAAVASKRRVAGRARVWRSTPIRKRSERACDTACRDVVTFVKTHVGVHVIEPAEPETPGPTVGVSSLAQPAPGRWKRSPRSLSVARRRSPLGSRAPGLLEQRRDTIAIVVVVVKVATGDSGGGSRCVVFRFKEGRSAARRARARVGARGILQRFAAPLATDPSSFSNRRRPSSRWSPIYSGGSLFQTTFFWYPARPCPRTRGSSARRACERARRRPRLHRTLAAVFSSCARATERCRRRKTCPHARDATWCGPEIARLSTRTPRHRRGRLPVNLRARSALRVAVCHGTVAGSGATPPRPGTPRADASARGTRLRA